MRDILLATTHLHRAPFRTGLIFLMICALAPFASAQTGFVKGTVTEVDGGSPLVGARVVIDSLKIGALTDVNGQFSFGNLPVGTHRVEVFFLTYETIDTLISISADEILEIEVAMFPAVLSGEVVEISAQALGQTQAINQQLNSDAITSMVSADRIQELPDVNAAEAIARLPGVAINRSGGEGQKVVIRGLEPKFAAITINGVMLPSNSGTDRSVDLSLIAPELLDGIEVFKSPLPDMDAEAVGGTVNLRLRKAPKRFRLLAKGLWGYNDLNSDWRDHKGVFQASNRVFEDKLGIVFQAGVERFNRGGDIYTRRWRRGATDTLGNTEVLGDRLILDDRREIRRRYNTSLGLDYELGKSQFSFFGLYSRTTRDLFRMQEVYRRPDQEINYIGRDTDNSLDLLSVFLTGNHTVGALKIDWTVANSRSNGQTPYDVEALFRDNSTPFSGSNPDGNPAQYLNGVSPDIAQTDFRSFNSRASSVLEETRAATLNFELPYKLTDKIFGSLKFGGKYKTIERDREVSQLSEDFYYLGSSEARGAISRYTAYQDSTPGANDLTFLPQNDQIMSFESFTRENDTNFRGLEGEEIPLSFNIDPTQLNHWYNSQLDILNQNRFALVDNYEVSESVAAAYMMLKFKVGNVLTVIPGFRYELSDNEYRGGFSTVNGRYGVNGVFRDTMTTQRYGEFLPHLHLKIQPLEWLDIRGSYSKTLARPDFLWIAPRTQVNEGTLEISSGNSDLRHMVSTNYEVAVTAYKGGYGLISVGAFRKDIENLFFPWQTFLVNDSVAQVFSLPDYQGFLLNSFTNTPSSRVYGLEVDFQTTLSFLPGAWSGLVFNVNYARLFSNVEIPYLTSERRLISVIPPIFETIYNSESRSVQLPSQAPQVLRASLGYDYKGFSARVSAAYQSTKFRRYDINKDFDLFDRAFWRVDASVKQRFADNWSVFLNLNNLSNQQDITFRQNESFLGTIETYGITATMGLQYKI